MEQTSTVIEYLAEEDLDRLSRLIEENGLLRNPAYKEMRESLERMRANAVNTILQRLPHPDFLIRQEFDKGTVNGLTMAINWADNILQGYRPQKRPDAPLGRTDEEIDDE
jgi:hypothetical protein